jgi:hypothetical protein
MCFSTIYMAHSIKIYTYLSNRSTIDNGFRLFYLYLHLYSLPALYIFITNTRRFLYKVSDTTAGL